MITINSPEEFEKHFDTERQIYLFKESVTVNCSINVKFGIYCEKSPSGVWGMLLIITT